MTWYNIALSLLVLGFFPLLLGNGVLRIIRYGSPTICDLYIAGTVSAWAICQILSVPMILMKLPFTSLEITLTAVYLPIVIVGIWKGGRPFLPFRPHLDSKWDWLFLALMLAVFLKVLQLLTINTYIDDDDSRMVVNAIDIIRTNRMFRTNPATGYFMEWAGELTRDVISPWAAFQAYISQMTLLFPTIMIHTVQPIALYLCLFAIQWELSRHLVGPEIRYRCGFCVMLWVVILYCGYNGWTAEGFLLLRVWQGKAVVAGIGIPCALLQMFRIYERGNAADYFLLAVINCGMCLLSNMGILFGGTLTIVFGLVYAVLKKNWRTVFFSYLTGIPCAAYALLSLKI